MFPERKRHSNLNYNFNGLIKLYEINSKHSGAWNKYAIVNSIYLHLTMNIEHSTENVSHHYRQYLPLLNETVELI